MTPGNRIGVCPRTGHEESPFGEAGELLRRVAGIEAGAGLFQRVGPVCGRGLVEF